MDKCLNCYAPKMTDDKCFLCGMEFPTDKEEKFKQFLYGQLDRSNKYLDDYVSMGEPLKGILVFKKEDLIELKKIMLEGNEKGDKNEKS